MDTGLNSLVAIARFHQLPAESDQLAHQFGVPGGTFSDTELLLAARALTLKAKCLTPSLYQLKNAMLPDIVKLAEMTVVQFQRDGFQEELTKSADLYAKQILFSPVLGQLQALT